MIMGYNLTLNPPKIKYESEELLLNNAEVQELIKAIKDYFKQVNVIYAADLTLSNNEWETCQTDFGSYKKRKDYTLRLMDLMEMTLYEDTIRFIINNDNGPDVDCKFKIGKDFFWFFEYESCYYD